MPTPEWIAHLNQTDKEAPGQKRVWDVVVTPPGPEKWETPPGTPSDENPGVLRVLLRFEYVSDRFGDELRRHVEEAVHERMKAL